MTSTSDPSERVAVRFVAVGGATEGLLAVWLLAVHEIVFDDYLTTAQNITHKHAQEYTYVVAYDSDHPLLSC